MTRLSVTLADAHDKYLAGLADGDSPYDSKVEAVREIIAERQASTTDGVGAVREELEAEIADLQRENDRLHCERRQLLERREENTELVRYTQEQRLESQSDTRRREHNIVRRMWWKVAGEPAEI